MSRLAHVRGLRPFGRTPAPTKDMNEAFPFGQASAILSTLLPDAHKTIPKCLYQYTCEIDAVPKCHWRVDLRLLKADLLSPKTIILVLETLC